MIRYVNGDATYPVGTGSRVIIHVVNDSGGWGRGFVRAVTMRWLHVEKAYREWAKATNPDVPFELGSVQYVAVGQDLWVANMVGQHNVVWDDGVPPVRYGAIRTALADVAAFVRPLAATVHAPRFGASLAGGSWREIEKLILEELADTDVTIYDMPGGKYNP